MMTLEERKELARTYAMSSLLPKELQGKPADCLVLLDHAAAVGEPFLHFANGVSLFQGKLFFKAEFLIARAMNSGLFAGSFEYRQDGEGDSLVVWVEAVSGRTGRTVVGPKVSMVMAKAEGWTRNMKYKNPAMAAHMLRLRAATFFVRLHCPQVLFGGMVAEEAEDVAAANPAGDQPTTPAKQPTIVVAEENPKVVVSPKPKPKPKAKPKAKQTQEAGDAAK